MELEEALRHARGIAGECHVNSRLWDRAEMAVPHYLWTLGMRKDRRGWCSACKRWMRLEPERMTPGYAAFDPYMEKFDGDEEPFLPVLYSGLQEHLFRERYNGTTDHLTTGTCPQCGAWVQFRSIYKGHRSLWDRLFLIEYAKSALEPRSAIVCVGLEIDVAWKHMDGLEPSVPMEITPRELCVFRYGQGADRFVREATWTGDGWEMRWAHRRECVSGFAPGRGLYQPGIQVRLDDESYRNAIAGTPFEHILADEGLLQETAAGDYYDRITFAARVAKYPCIEYLNRLGMTQLARQAIDKICGKTPPIDQGDACSKGVRPKERASHEYGAVRMGRSGKRGGGNAAKAGGKPRGRGEGREILPEEGRAAGGLRGPSGHAGRAGHGPA